jgi:3-oxoacyl-[acyl-carrier-protein] synthase II
MVTALGLDWTSNREGFRSGRIAFEPVTLFDVSRHRVKKAAAVPLPQSLAPIGKLSLRSWNRLDRAARMLLIATEEAWTQSGWNRSGKIPVILGTTSGGMSLGETYYRQTQQLPGCHRRQPSRVIHYLAHRQGLDLLEAFGISGPVTIIANACASGANAIGHAWEWLRHGNANQVLAGGYDALSEMVFTGFDTLQALSPTQCRPFDLHRDGLSLGEGAAVFSLETLEHATARGAAILGEIIGYGASTDLHHLTQPHPQGCAAIRSMTVACAKAGIAPENIDYVNAHGTGTTLNDSAEAEALQQWAGPHAANLNVSSTKAGIGHLLGAAGAVETGVCLMALQGQWLPPSTSISCPDPAVAFRLVQIPESKPLEFALTNSFGFGGANATLILRRWS